LRRLTNSSSGGSGIGGALVCDVDGLLTAGFSYLKGVGEEDEEDGGRCC
jgi:hypothetical protein